MNLMTLAVFGMFFIFIMGFISNTVSGIGGTTFCTSNDLDDVYCKNLLATLILGCPLPTISTINYLNGTIVDDVRGAKYTCGLNPIGEFTSVEPQQYNATLYNVIPYGWYYFVGDTITDIFFKATALATLIVGFLSPLNFNIFGYGINDIGAVAVTIIVVIYAISYLAIGAFLWKTISPFTRA